MKKLLSLLLLFFLSSICFSQSEQERDELFENQQKQWAKEMFLAELKDVLINGQLPAQEATTKELISVFGKPEKIEPYSPDCNDEPERIRNAKKHEIYYYDKEKTIFFVYDNHADLFSLNFSNDHYLTTAKIKLDKNTPREDLLKVFPKIQFTSDGENASETTLSTDPENKRPYYYLLMFDKDKKLKEITIQQDAC